MWGSLVILRSCLLILDKIWSCVLWREKFSPKIIKGLTFPLPVVPPLLQAHSSSQYNNIIVCKAPGEIHILGSWLLLVNLHLTLTNEHQCNFQSHLKIFRRAAHTFSFEFLLINTFPVSVRYTSPSLMQPPPPRPVPSSTVVPSASLMADSMAPPGTERGAADNAGVTTLSWRHLNFEGLSNSTHGLNLWESVRKWILCDVNSLYKNK